MLPELLLIIFNYTECDDYYNIKLVNKFWYNLVISSNLFYTSKYIVYSTAEQDKQVKQVNKKILYESLKSIIYNSNIHLNKDPRLLSIFGKDNLYIHNPIININDTIFKSVKILNEVIKLLINKDLNLLYKVIYLYNNFDKCLKDYRQQLNLPLNYDNDITEMVK